MLIFSNSSQRGFNLVELTIGIAIVAILFALALPSYSQWSTNAKIRNWAESIQNGLQLTRVEALKRIGYQGGMCVEHEPELFDPTDDCKANLAMLKEWIG